jgi:hypothetical protein
MLEIPNKDGTYQDPDDPNPNPPVSEDPNLETQPEPEPEPGPDLTAQLAEEREHRIRLEERLAAQERVPAPTPAPTPEPTVLTRQDLRAAVNEGKIDEDQMEELWAKQNREQINRDMVQHIETRDRTRDTENVVETEMDKYVAAYPGIKDTGTPEWKRVKTEYDFFIKLGDKDNRATELKACRAAFGSNTEKIPERTASHRETPGDSSGAPGGGGSRPVDIWNRVPKRFKSYYKSQVEQGFKTLKDVEADIPYMDDRH